MAGSQVGVNYTLMNSGNAQQTAGAGTGVNDELDAGERFIFTPYTINAVDATTGQDHVRKRSGSRTFLSAQDFTVSGGGTNVFRRSRFPIYLSSSQNGASYQLLRDGVPGGLHNRGLCTTCTAESNRSPVSTQFALPDLETAMR